MKCLWSDFPGIGGYPQYIACTKVFEVFTHEYISRTQYIKDKVVLYLTAFESELGPLDWSAKMLQAPHLMQMLISVAGNQSISRRLQCLDAHGKCLLSTDAAFHEARGMKTSRWLAHLELLNSQELSDNQICIVVKPC